MEDIKESNKKIYAKKILSNILIILILVVVGILILMQSPINPLGNKINGSDSSVFIYGGNLIRNGKILYKDFFDHKGPMLYLFETIGLAISNGDTVGIWILEVIFMFANLCMLYKISRLYSNSKYINILAAIISIIPLCSCLQCGNLSEEFALSFIIYSLYVFSKFTITKKVRNMEIYLVGICFAIVFMLRPNMIALWIVYIPTVIIDYICDKRYKELLKSIGIFILGTITVIVPTILYFIFNNAFSDFIYCFLKFNFMYTGSDGNKDGIIDAILFFILNIKINIIIPCILIGSFIRRKCKKIECKEVILQILFFAITLLLISISGRKYGHYAMILIPCYIIPITWTMKYIIELKHVYVQVISVLIFTIIFCVLEWESVYIDILQSITRTIPNLNYNKVVEYIKENTDEDDNVLILENDCNLYNLTNRKYNGKYAYQYPIINIDYRIYEEIMEEMEKDKPKLIVYEGSYDMFNEIINVSYEYEKNERIMLSYFYANIEKMCEKRNLYEI